MPMRRMFSSRSWAENPKPNRLANSSPCAREHPGPAFRPWRTLSPSRTKLCTPIECSLWSSRLATVLFRTLRPVNQTTQPRVAVEFLPFFAGNGVFVPVDLDLIVVGHGSGSGVRGQGQG